MYKHKYIIALDQGTTNTRVALINYEGRIISTHFEPSVTYYPNIDWVEQDTTEILQSCLKAITGLISKNKIAIKDIVSLGITNQRETVVVWDKETSKAIYNSISWQDRRTLAECRALQAQNLGEYIKQKTGLILDPYFSALKLKWILDNVPGARSKAMSGKLCFGTIDSWLLYNFTAPPQHRTDTSNASRTMLFNIHTQKWDEDLLKLFDIPRQILPVVCDSAYSYGTFTTKELRGFTIDAIIGDQQAALFGQLCIEEGDTKITYGTGTFLVTNTDNKKIFVDNFLTTIAWTLNNKTSYALEGSIFSSGTAINWLKENILGHKIGTLEQLSRLASSVPDSGGVYFVSALSGLGAPYWDEYARGLIVGLNTNTRQGHIVRAGLESIAFQATDLILALKNATPYLKINDIKVDGGISQNAILTQFQADILQLKIVKGCAESTALGAAYLAGLQCGYWKDLTKLAPGAKVEVLPSMSRLKAEEKYYFWKKATQRSLNWLLYEK